MVGTSPNTAYSIRSVLDQDGQVLDGRNRLAACQMAGVQPMFETYDGKNVDSYALSVNITRRHLTKGQAAMIAAKAANFLGPEEIGEGPGPGAGGWHISRGHEVTGPPPHIPGGGR